ncbi:MAG TPA: hypothetical protein PLI45_01090 [Candidatus Woesebacteria bacterium]|nr:hypothetical protein [Candidatus Woesebacteria bacterium]
MFAKTFKGQAVLWIIIIIAIIVLIILWMSKNPSSFSTSNTTPISTPTISVSPTTATNSGDFLATESATLN